MCISFQIDLGQVLSDTCRALRRPLEYLRDPAIRLSRLTGAMKTLLSRRDYLNNRVQTAELAGQKPTNQYQDWLGRVTDVDAKVSQIQTRHQQERSWRWCINRQAERRLANIDALMREAGNLLDVVAERLPPEGIQEEPSAGAVSIATQQSMGSYLSLLRSYLQDDMIRIIGIWGMGGVGKTTLLHSLNRELHSSAKSKGLPQFEQVIWVVASKDYNVGKLQHDIARRLGLPECEDKDQQAGKIFQFLKNKSFLLLLDDLWEQVDFREVGIPHPHRDAPGGSGPKQKVVFTTRGEEVCGQMEARRKVKLECLKEEEAWQLFQEKVGEDALRAHQRIPELARQVANECDGLPLALVVIGTAMSTKKTPMEWLNAITLLQKSRIYEMHGVEDKILPKLKFSYDSLPDEIFRKCFLLCSLWPEDHSISKAELIECWMGHGLVDETKFNDINEAYDSGHVLIGGLLAACLLEHGNDKNREVKMHDVVRDLALWIASDCGKMPKRFIVSSGDAIGVSEDLQREVERISLMESNFVDTSGLPANCTKLETLILQKKKSMSFNSIIAEFFEGTRVSFNSIIAGFFEGTRALTYLDLSKTKIRNLPEEIGQLSKLRYLNLSDTEITTLPVQLGCLRELRFLLLRDLRNSFVIPEGVLQNLVMLSLIDMIGTWCENWWELAKLPGCLKGVGIMLETIEALHHVAQLSNVPIWRLGLMDLTEFNHPLQLLSPSLLGSRNIQSSIQKLKVQSCESLELVSMDANVGNGLGPNCCLTRLEEMKLTKLPKLKEIVWRGVVPWVVLPSLARLTIYGCHELSNISWVAWLPSLEILEVQTCYEMEHVVDKISEGGSGDENGEGCVAFPSLTRLQLYDLPNLRTFGGGRFEFSSLEVLEVLLCPKMKMLPFEAEVAGSKLRTICGSIEWGMGLEMDDDVRAALLPYFFA